MMLIHEELNHHIGIANYIILFDGGLLEIIFYSTTINYILKNNIKRNISTLCQKKSGWFHIVTCK
jgi:hypothetical protein